MFGLLSCVGGSDGMERTGLVGKTLLNGEDDEMGEGHSGRKALALANGEEHPAPRGMSTVRKCYLFVFDLLSSSPHGE